MKLLTLNSANALKIETISPKEFAGFFMILIAAPKKLIAN
jgi:hypothetical protein